MPHALSSTCAVADRGPSAQLCHPILSLRLRHSFRPSKTAKRRRLCSVKSSSVTEAKEHAQFIQEVAAINKPERLAALMEVLQAQNNTVVPPNMRSDLHPLMIPLASQQSGQSTVCTGLLRQVSLSGNEKAMPVVRMTPGSKVLTLAARTTDEYLHRALAEEDVASGPGTIAEAAGQAGQHLYTAGTAQDNLHAYLTRKAGMYPDVVERLVANHLDKKDNMSALITAEWYMRPKHFPGWGRPYEFAAGLYRHLGRLEESRDSLYDLKQFYHSPQTGGVSQYGGVASVSERARVAMRLPWWSLVSGFAATRDLAGLQGGAIEVHKALTEQTMAANGALPPGAMPAKDSRQVLIEEADFAMNTVAAGEASWDEIRSQVSDKYQEAGLPELAKFVAGA